METPQATSEDIGAELSRLKKDLDVQKEIAALRMEVTLQRSYFKWVAWTAGICLAVLGFFGFKAWTDLTTSAQTLYEKQLLEMQDRYSNLSRGFSLVDSGRSRDAIPYLVPLYDANHYDEPVVSALLFALMDINDCQEGLRRLKELRQDEARFLRLQDPIIYHSAGVLLRDCSSDDTQALEEARNLFELSLKRSAADDPERRFSLYSLFTYYFIKHDLKTAERYLREASEIESDFLSAEPPLDEPWAKALLKRKDPIAKELKPLWTRIVKQQKREP
jgi:hypothetical protein